MNYNVTHRTTYTGSEPVSVGKSQAWLKPRDFQWQSRVAYDLHVDPAPSMRNEQTDYFGNTFASLSFDAGYHKLIVTAVSRVEVRPRKYPDPLQSTPWEKLATQLRQPTTADWLEAGQFVFDSPRAAASPALAEYARQSFQSGTPILAGLIDLTQRIYSEFEYNPLATTVSTPVAEVFENRKGVCQDFAHMQLAMLRSLGLAGRYVSGYLRTIPADGETEYRGADASHAWLSVFCGETGWVDVDPTNNLLVSEDHITAAWGRDYSDVPPLRGVFIGGGTLKLDVEVEVQPLTAATADR